jgi:hypothetical protein
MAKETPWLEIKTAFLKGVTAKELAVKYKIKARSITDKAYEERWNDEKTIISENIRDKVTKRVEHITDLAMQRLEGVLLDEDIKTSDLVQAIGKAFDISGLKSSKQELTGKDGSALIQKVFVTAQEKQEADKHIDSVINEN